MVQVVPLLAHLVLAVRMDIHPAELALESLPGVTWKVRGLAHWSDVRKAVQKLSNPVYIYLRKYGTVTPIGPEIVLFCCVVCM